MVASFVLLLKRQLPKTKQQFPRWCCFYCTLMVTNSTTINNQGLHFTSRATSSSKPWRSLYLTSYKFILLQVRQHTRWSCIQEFPINLHRFYQFEWLINKSMTRMNLSSIENCVTPNKNMRIHLQKLWLRVTSTPTSNRWLANELQQHLATKSNHQQV